MSKTAKRPDGAASRLAGMPPAAARLVAAAVDSLQRQQPVDAERALRSALQQVPDNAEVLRLLAIALRANNRNAEALELARLAAVRNPHDALIQSGLGVALDACGDADAAVAAFRKAAELAPNSDRIWANLGKTLSDDGRHEQARDALQRAVALNAHPLTLKWLADTLRVLGHADEAARHYRRAIAHDSADGAAWLGLAGLSSLRLESADVEVLERALQRRQLASADRITLGFALGKALEDQGRPAPAFAAYRDANALMRRLHPWDAAGFSRFLDDVLAAPTPPPESGEQRGDEVIFIVSLPRSGSSLVEQILASHQQVTGAGELTAMSAVIASESDRRGQPYPRWVASATPSDWRRLGQEYLDRCARWRRPGMRFTDKLPGNWIRVGTLLAMLPGARVIDIRRDPLETCFSCFRTLFAEGSQTFSYDMRDIAAYWRDYERASRQWQVRFPHRYRLQSYETLVADFPAQARALLDFCGLPFDPACLRFHETRRSVRTASAVQVREPVRRDTARAGRYGALLDPLRAELKLPMSTQSPED